MCPRNGTFENSVDPEVMLCLECVMPLLLYVKASKIFYLFSKQSFIMNYRPFQYDKGNMGGQIFIWLISHIEDLL